MLTITEGETAVRLARTAIKECLENGRKIKPENLPDVFKEKRGVFVTLNTKRKGKNSGLHRKTVSSFTAWEAIILSAINAAQEDPRFYPVKPDEVEDLFIEVTILTVPKRIIAKPREIPGNIMIGRDGLIVSTNLSSGLLLPQVAVEHGFDSTEFLCQTCVKAGLMPDAWLEGAEVYSFEGQIFEEIEPGGQIKEKDIRCGDD